MRVGLHQNFFLICFDVIIVISEPYFRQMTSLSISSYKVQILYIFFDTDFRNTEVNVITSQNVLRRHLNAQILESNLGDSRNRKILFYLSNFKFLVVYSN